MLIDPSIRPLTPGLLRLGSEGWTYLLQTLVGRGHSRNCQGLVEVASVQGSARH